MSTTPLLLLTLTIVAIYDEVWAQAPGDEEDRCTVDHNDPPVYPDTQKNLMDSWNYVNLLPGNGTGRTPITTAVWNDYSYDGNDEVNLFTQTYWQQTSGGICRFISKVCGFTSGSQDNWLFTQYINKSFDTNTYNYDVSISVTISYSMSSCRRDRSPPCNQGITLLRYMTNSVQLPSLEGNGFMNRDNYQNFANTSAQVNNIPYTNTYTFTLPASTTGFYIAVRDNGTCMSISRLRVYRNNCKEQTTGSVTYPESPAPVDSYVNVLVICSKNSSAIGYATCMSDGTWGRENQPECHCDNGYEEVEETDDDGYIVHHCRECLKNTYRNKTLNMPRCLPCPNNSVSDGGAAMCRCKPDFCRASDEDITYPCTTHPSTPRNLGVNQSDTVVNVTWDLPEDDGGRSDLYLAVCICEVLECSDSSKVLCITTYDTTHMFTGLEPVTRYKVQVRAENGVTDQCGSPESAVSIEFSTLEGAPECVHNPKSVDNVVLVWGPPLVPNGIITGYEVSFEFCAIKEEIDEEGSGIINETNSLPFGPQEDDEIGCTSSSYKLRPDTFFFVLNNDVLPDYPHNLTYNIRARTGVARYGTWCPNETIVPKFVCPPPPVCNCSDVVLTVCATTTLVVASSSTTKSTHTTSSTMTCPTPTITAAGLESCVVYMGASAGVFIVIASLLSCLFSCTIACLCHKHKMKNYKIKVKKHLQSKWDY